MRPISGRSRTTALSRNRFHLVKALNQAVDEVRKEQSPRYTGAKAIKGLRWLLSMHSRHRTKGHTE